MIHVYNAKVKAIKIKPAVFFNFVGGFQLREYSLFLQKYVIMEIILWKINQRIGAELAIDQTVRHQRLPNICLG